MYIYVQAQDAAPLMPTRRAGKVRRMLRDGKAVIVSHTPFTIRLMYDTTRYTLHGGDRPCPDGTYNRPA